jgi:hypothetical protein
VLLFSQTAVNNIIFGVELYLSTQAMNCGTPPLVGSQHRQQVAGATRD